SIFSWGSEVYTVSVDGSPSLDDSGEAAVDEHPASAATVRPAATRGRVLRRVFMVSVLVCDQAMREVKRGSGESRLRLVAATPPGTRCTSENMAWSCPLTRSGPASITW